MEWEFGLQCCRFWATEKWESHWNSPFFAGSLGNQSSTSSQHWNGHHCTYMENWKKCICWKFWAQLNFSLIFPKAKHKQRKLNCEHNFSHGKCCTQWLFSSSVILFSIFQFQQRQNLSSKWQGKHMWNLFESNEFQIRFLKLADFFEKWLVCQCTRMALNKLGCHGITHWKQEKMIWWSSHAFAVWWGKSNFLFAKWILSNCSCLLFLLMSNCSQLLFFALAPWAIWWFTLNQSTLIQKLWAIATVCSCELFCSWTILRALIAHVCSPTTVVPLLSHSLVWKD